jgi:hypothetical protein
MEYFPAIDEEQFEFIKKVIEDSDYYIVIIGDRYGSLAPDGLSFTEKEFDFASSIGKKIIAIIKKESAESDNLQKSKLEKFKQKVSSGRMVKYCDANHEIPTSVLMSLIKTISAYPSVGWIRGDTITNPELLKELNDQRKENELLRQQIEEKERNKNIPIDFELADFSEKIELIAKPIIGGGTKFSREVSWKDLFSLISPYLIKNPSEEAIRGIIESEFFENIEVQEGIHLKILEPKIMNQIRVQFQAYGLIEVGYLKTTSGDRAVFWSITTEGQKKMVELISKRSPSKS